MVLLIDAGGGIFMASAPHRTPRNVQYIKSSGAYAIAKTKLEENNLPLDMPDIFSLSLSLSNNSWAPPLLVTATTFVVVSCGVPRSLNSEREREREMCRRTVSVRLAARSLWILLRGLYLSEHSVDTAL